MSALLRVAAPARERVRAGLPALLAALPDPLHVLVEQVTGLSGEIDVVARDGRGHAVAVRLALGGDDLSALGDLLAQCDWLAPRLRDWLKLNPALGVRPELGVRGLLLAAQFDARTVAAARALGSGRLALARVSAFELQGSLQLVLEPLGLAPDREPAGPPTAADEPPGEVVGRTLAEIGPEVAALESRFRTGLRDDELGLPRRPRSAPRG